LRRAVLQGVGEPLLNRDLAPMIRYLKSRDVYTVFNTNAALLKILNIDPTTIPPDRHGINDSIVGRVQRFGGTAVIESHAGTGTEVEIRIPRRQP